MLISLMFLPCINKSDDDDDGDDDKLSLCRPSHLMFSIPLPSMGEEVGVIIHPMVLHGSSNQDKLSLCRPSRLFSVPLPSMRGGGQEL